MNAPQKYIGQVSDVRSGAGFDEERLASYLEGSIKGFRGPLSVRQFEGGQSNPTYLLVTPDAKYVMRRKPPGVLLKSAHAVDREYRITRTLFDQGFPVAEPLVLCEDDEVVGTMFYVMRHVEGRIFWNCQMPDLSREERGAVYDSANETLAKLHTIDYAAIGLGDYGRPGDYFQRQIKRWSGQYEASATQVIPAMDKLIEWLPSRVPRDNGLSSIVHGDFSFHNLMVHPNGSHVVAVLDWELSTIGHPLGDLMYHCMEWYRPPGIDDRGTLSNANLAALGIPSLEEYVARYSERTGFQIDADDLGFYSAFNLFRVAAILQGVAGRIRDGIVTAKNAQQIIARIEPIANAAWDEAQKASAA